MSSQAMANATLDAETANSQSELTRRPQGESWLAGGYGVVLLASFSIWFLAIRAPLWVDETLSYWQIAAGFRQIWARSVQANYFAAYPYILWLTKTLFGDKELTLRIPSILAMLAAVYVFYCCARELFDWDVSLIAVLLFVLQRYVAFAAIDVRPYGFALLVTNLTILMFLRWMRTRRTKYAALFGIAAGGIFYFHYLFVSVVPAFVIYYLLTQRASLRADLRQIGIAFAGFVLVLLPVLPRLKYIYQTRTIHSFTEEPSWAELIKTLNPGLTQLLILLGAILLAILARRLITPDGAALRKLLFCASLTLVPTFCLYVLSVISSVHVFIWRYLLESVPGMALCWGWIFSLIDWRPLRLLFCFGFAASCMVPAYRSPAARAHEVSFKYALQYADASAAQDHAPLLMASPFVEQDYQPLPAVPLESMAYAPLSYYKVNAQVIPLPGSLTEETKRQAQQFLSTTAQEPRRFLFLGGDTTGPTANYLAYYFQNTHTAHVVGDFNGIWVVEFVPRPDY